MSRQEYRPLSSQERKRLRRFIILVSVVVLLLLLFFPGRSLLSYHRMQNELARLQQRNQILEKRNRELAAEIERLKTDDAYLEEVARKKYGLLRDNEEVFDFSRRNAKRKKK